MAGRDKPTTYPKISPLPPTLSVAGGGHVRLRWPADDDDPFSRPVVDDLVVGFYADAESGWFIHMVCAWSLGLSVSDLRVLPLAELEAWANSPDGDRRLRASMRRSAPRIRAEVDRVFTSAEDSITVAKPAPLSPPPRRGLDDDFLRLVVEHHRWHVVNGRPPNIAIADDLGAGYTAKQVSKWMNKARERGLAPRVGKGNRS